ncbi:hypothetical protein A5660_03825 [Mycobacterium alsense]|nr:hypothetical protein A5660_03825 [Mycobacterium alsense]
MHPNVPGVPWYAALLLAVTATAIGYGIDAGHKELTHVFAGFYIAGCVAAVLAVRQDGVFTAIIQPPLILFAAVPGAYWMFHGRKIGNLKDLLINCGYPLIERFPLMLGTAGGVLLLGLVRWYFGASSRAAAATDAGDDGATTGARSFVGGVAAKLNALLGFSSPDDDADGTPSAGTKRTRATERSRKSGSRTERARGGRSTAGTGRTHARRTRPPLDDDGAPRRRARDSDPADAPKPRRRPRPQGDPDPRQRSRETRRDPRTRRNPYDRPYDGPPPRTSRFDSYDPSERPFERPYDRPYDTPYEPRRRRPAPSANGSGTTHHPISQVRYRGSGPRDEPRGRSRAPRGFPAESWEYEG